MGPTIIKRWNTESKEFVSAKLWDKYFQKEYGLTHGDERANKMLYIL
jgi:hypothetical protein